MQATKKGGRYTRGSEKKKKKKEKKKDCYWIWRGCNGVGVGSSYIELEQKKEWGGRIVRGPDATICKGKRKG